VESLKVSFHTVDVVVCLQQRILHICFGNWDS